ncbi:hypothetical protein LOTGIDRAFT_175882 [Lottia gigantea]|uniref:Uncharacterized protein n=1 Tax=Lottia gigantea TaxID=225164 RepID=V3ZBK4_LOTGI|nr:hypothetical protein LOTGIDRAFT_175882 [Lottia gigantea]ESO88393.1 hypothetical protein LOTGIDRAFT_175882 [Lottia gigantea]
MAEKRKNTDKRDFCQEAEGYLHDVEEVKQSTKNQSKYFCCKFQKESSVHKVVCFSPNKFADFQNAEKLCSPVKLSQIKYSPGKRNIDILVNQNSDITIVPTKLPFKRRLLTKTTDVAEAISITKILEDPNVNMHATYNIKANVLQLQDESTVVIYGAKKRTKEIIVHDGTAHICISLFEHLIDEVDVNKSYEFLNVGIRNYLDKKSITTKLNTCIAELTEPIEVPKEFKLNLNNMREGTVNSASIQSDIICPNCKRRDPNFDHVMDDPTVKVIKCSNKLCLMTSRKKSFKHVVNGSLVLEFNDTIGTYSLNNDVATCFVEEINQPNLIADSSAFENYLLDDKNRFLFSMNARHITKIQLNKS